MRTKLATIINGKVWINGCLLLNHATTAKRIWMKLDTGTDNIVWNS